MIPMIPYPPHTCAVSEQINNGKVDALMGRGAFFDASGGASVERLTALIDRLGQKHSLVSCLCLERSEEKCFNLQ